MKKENILKESYNFNRIINAFKPYKYKDYVIYIERVNQDNYKFGFSVGKKIGNAVIRNKIKRQLKSIVDKKVYQKNFNCIIIVGKGILNRKYDEMQFNLLKAFENLDIYKEEKNDSKE